MPRFYFSIADNTVLEDNDGTELPDVEAAKRHARIVALELMHHREGMLGHPWSNWVMLVKDDKGEEVLSFRVAEMVEG